MTRRVGTALGLWALVLAAGCTGGAGSAPAAAPAPLPAPEGFRVAVEHAESPSAGGLVAWESRWVLTWEPVPGAAAYDLWFGTNEGAPSRPRRTAEEPRLSLQAAAGTSSPERLRRDREAGLLFTSSQLLVAVSARAGETAGPLSPYFPVGDAPAGGVPVPTRLGAHGAGPHGDGLHGDGAH